MVLLLTGGGGFTRRTGLRRIKERLNTVPGASNVRDEPSRLRPRKVIAEINIEMFLETELPREEAKIEVAWHPREKYDIQGVQSMDTAVSLGWHKDDAHPEIGTIHLQKE